MVVFKVFFYRLSFEFLTKTKGVAEIGSYLYNISTKLTSTVVTITIVGIHYKRRFFFFRKQTFYLNSPKAICYA